MKIGQVKRNDIQGALRAFRSGCDSSDEVRDLLMLQDDPTTLIAALNEIRTDEWDESQHPRAENGQFGEGGGNSTVKGGLEFNRNSHSERAKAVDWQKHREPLGTQAPSYWTGTPTAPTMSREEAKAKATELRDKASYLRAHHNEGPSGENSYYRQADRLEQVDALEALRAGYTKEEVVDPGFDDLDMISQPGHLYRGVATPEFEATIAKGRGLNSDNRASASFEGMSFGYEANTAYSYANQGSDDPRRTGKPTYLVEVKANDAITYNKTAGYPQAPVGAGVDHDHITRMWKVEARDGKRVMNEMAIPKAQYTADEIDSKISASKALRDEHSDKALAAEDSGNKGLADHHWQEAEKHETALKRWKAETPALGKFDEWNEEDHPRAENGQFGSGGGGGGKDANATNAGRPGNVKDNRPYHVQINELDDKIDEAKKFMNEAGDRALEHEAKGDQAEADKHWAIAEAHAAERKALKQEKFRKEVGKAVADKLAADPDYQKAVETDRATERAEKKAYFDTVADPENIAALKERKIVDVQNLGGGVNITKLVTLDDGSKAVWKPAQGEDKNLRSNVPGGTYFRREAAASALAKVVGVEDLVPAVVAHEGKVMGPYHFINKLSSNATAAMDYGTDGSLHAYAPGTPLVNHASRDSLKFEREAAERMRVFDYIIGNSDRHGGNVLVHERDGKKYPVLIDHGLAFPLGKPDQFIQPRASLHPENGILTSTRDMLAGINDDKIAETLHAHGIEREAAKHAVMRSMYVKLKNAVIDTNGYDHTDQLFDGLVSSHDPAEAYKVDPETGKTSKTESEHAKRADAIVAKHYGPAKKEEE